MDNIIRLHGDQHRETLALLPWYVTGQLEAAERTQVEAHLAGCAECQAELKFERRLEGEVATAPLDVEQGWASMVRLIQAPRRGTLGKMRAWGADAGRRFARAWRAPWLGWAVAACAGVFAAALLITPPPAPATAPYHTLSTPPAGVAGNVVVIFRPDTRELAMRRVLKGADARVVDGPTAADAYVLRVPAAEQAVALARLRAQGEVVLAEPIDAGETP